MKADQSRLVHSETTSAVIGAYYQVYNALGTGFLEQVYENAMRIALARRGIGVFQQPAIEVSFLGEVVGTYRADLLIPGKVLIEVKAVHALGPAHDAQLINYLKATRTPVGMILNFGPNPEIRRRIPADRLIGSDPCQSVVKTNV